MPGIEGVFYSDGERGAPAYDGLMELLRKGRRKEFAKCWVREGTVPDRDIDRAILHRLRFENDPEKHTFRI